jgi:hypothetical protein
VSDEARQEEVARLLREQGPVPAPPDLASSVMAEVRRTPRHETRRGHVVSRALRFGAAAAALVAIGVGVSRLDLGAGSGSFGSGSSAGAGGVASSALDEAANSVGEKAAGSYPGTVQDGVARFEVAVPAARHALGPLWSADRVKHGRIVLDLSAAEFRTYVPRLRHAARGTATLGPATQSVRVILRRSK